MTPKEVKRKLAERGIRQMDLAKKWKLRPGAVSQFVHGKFTSARLEKRLAKVLGLSVEELRGDKSRAPSPPIPTQGVANGTNTDDR